MHCVCDWIRVCSHPALTQGNGLRRLCCEARARTDTHTYLQYTHHTHPLIVTDRAERAALSHHDESLARKKNGGREGDALGELTAERMDWEEMTYPRTEGERKRLHWCHSGVSVRALHHLFPSVSRQRPEIEAVHRGLIWGKGKGDAPADTLLDLICPTSKKKVSVNASRKLWAI